MASRTLPGWFVHFLIDLSKNEQARVPFHKPQDCILDAYMYLLLKECRPYVFVFNVMAYINKKKYVGSEKVPQSDCLTEGYLGGIWAMPIYTKTTFKIGASLSLATITCL